MMGFLEDNQSPTTIVLQIVAVRFEGGTELHHIVEHLLYNEMNGKVQRMPREAVVDYITKFGVGSVITRDPYRTKADVILERVEARTWLRTRPDDKFNDNLYSLYAFEIPNAAANTFHAVAIQYAGDRDLSNIHDVIVYSDRNGEAERVRRADLVTRIDAAPNVYVVETPRIERSVLTVDRSGPTPVVSGGQSSVAGEDVLFQLTSHQGSISDL